MTNKITDEDLTKNINTVMASVVDAFDRELYACTEDKLITKYWHFEWNSGRTIPQNMYTFFDMLELFNGFCRRWETHHNGTYCVVERVRDKYLMPKILAFTAEVTTHMKDQLENGDKYGN